MNSIINCICLGDTNRSVSVSFLCLGRHSYLHLFLFVSRTNPALAPCFRVHAHAASALINFCEAVERDTLLPYVDPIVGRLLKLLNPAGDPALVRRYVQEQAITTLAMVADASEVTFAKVSKRRCEGKGVVCVGDLIMLPIFFFCIIIRRLCSCC